MNTRRERGDDRDTEHLVSYDPEMQQLIDWLEENIGPRKHSGNSIYGDKWMIRHGYSESEYVNTMPWEPELGYPGVFLLLENESTATLAVLSDLPIFKPRHNRWHYGSNSRLNPTLLDIHHAAIEDFTYVIDDNIIDELMKISDSPDEKKDIK